MSRSAVLTLVVVTIGGLAALSGSASSATGDATTGKAHPIWSAPLPKGDRLGAGARLSKSAVRNILTSGSSSDFRATMRDGSGRVVYDSSAVHRLTVVTRDAEIPSVPVPQPPAVLATPDEARPVRRPADRAAVPSGCERLVSVLARTAASDLTGRCLT